jgi:hypothetical protein
MKELLELSGVPILGDHVRRGMQCLSNPAVAASRVTDGMHFMRWPTRLRDGGGFVTGCMSRWGHRPPASVRPRPPARLGRAGHRLSS